MTKDMAIKILQRELDSYEPEHALAQALRMAIEAMEHEPNTKNNLAVDCIDRQATLDAIIKRLGIKNETYLLEAERAIYQQILAMPSVTPQLSSELEKNSKKLEKNFGELDCISRADVNQVIEDYMDEQYQYHVLSDRTRERAFGANVVKARINELPTVTPQEPTALPSVTPIRPRGHWIKYDKEYFTAEKLTPVIHSIRECSECHTRIADFCGEMKYCPNCGADMREVEDDKRRSNKNNS